MPSEALLTRGWAPSAGSRPRARLLHLHRQTVVLATLDCTFAFFADAANLERLTPPWLNFHIVTPTPIDMRQGVEIDYQIVLHGWPIPWRSQIDVWEPGVRFVDRQVVGPYRWWHHEHGFEAVPEGTRVTDHVEFLPRASWMTRRWVQRDLDRIFDYRQEVLTRLFGPAPGRTERATSST